MRRVLAIVLTLMASSLPSRACDDPSRAESGLLEEAILTFVNAPETTRDVLLDALGARSSDPLWNYTATRAADAILAYRSGPSGPIDTLRELYDIDGTGTQTLARIEGYVKANSAVSLDSAVLGVVNDPSVTSSFLQSNGVLAQASTDLIRYRDGGADLAIGSSDDERVPYERVFGDASGSSAGTWPAWSTDAVPYVGPATLQRLDEIAMRDGYRYGVVDREDCELLPYLLDAEGLASIVQSLQESLWEDEVFAGYLWDLTDGDEALYLRVMGQLEQHIEETAAPLEGTRYTDYDTARDAVNDVAGVRTRVESGGWTYLNSIGIYR